ncbi:hypothetical protein AZI86_16955 [Bdellovibrio bacteriovorus]|uniref:Uncharacterized protein n=1 Tax=Bdellovibrio bacteriovorus TaxID=959 RepID=A0A150WEP2_BDEBC|nr:hypothetical protein [Bdellovibrio bacteriovorus]KYG61403.1 hypothetical protein AZI86_16955 [Bdellovibrio bacteriovorus]
MKKMMLFAMVLCAAVSAQTQEKAKILDCMQPVYLDDPNFQQGTEMFFDVLSVDGKFEVKFTSGDLRSETIFKSEANAKSIMSVESASFYASWNTPARVDMVLRDFGTRWRGLIMFPEGYQSETLTMAPGSEVDLACVLKSGAALYP